MRFFHVNIDMCFIETYMGILSIHPSHLYTLSHVKLKHIDSMLFWYFHYAYALFQYILIKGIRDKNKTVGVS